MLRGGHNHRMGLYDMAMVKDNHLLAAGSLEDTQKAIETLKACHPDARIEKVIGGNWLRLFQEIWRTNKEKSEEE